MTATSIEGQGALLRQCVTDVKRDIASCAVELGITKDALDAAIQTGEGARPICDAMLAKYPLSAGDLLVEEDDCGADGFIHYSAEFTDKSGRVIPRKNHNGDTAPYYRYMDTAMSRLAPFKPELIEELVYVDNNDPKNPLVVYNKGHLLTQFTWFVGPVNFYHIVRGVKHCTEFNTGDTCFITPHVPHTFASRDKDHPANAKIVAVTFSNVAREALTKIVHFDAQQFIRAAGNRRELETVLAPQLKRHLQLSGQFVGDLAKSIGNDDGITEDALDKGTLSAEQWNVVKKQCGFDASRYLPLLAEEEVVLQVQGADQRARPLATSRHFPDFGAFEVRSTTPTFDLSSQLWQYLYNAEHGTPLTIHLANGVSFVMGPGDSAVLKPFGNATAERVQTDSATVSLVVVRCPGFASQELMHEMSLFAQKGAANMGTQKSAWW